MKKTVNINLAGYPFTIDEDAFNLLKDYLDTIRYAFDTKDDTEDLASDIEARIAEILMESYNGTPRIITFQEVSKVIERIGRPSDFIDIEETVSITDTDDQKNIRIEEERISPPPYNPQGESSRNPFVRKKLFRDPQNSMLGGVCSGLAYYLHIDVTIIRLLTVLLFFLSASTVAIVYIVLWIVVPEARTPLQRMKMMGEDTTVENIGKTVTENYQDYSTDQESQQKNKPTGFFHTLFSVFVKCLVILGLIIACPLLLALAIGLFGCIIAVFVLGVIIAGGASDTFLMFNTASEEVLAFYILLAVIGGIITVGIPLWLLIRKSWRKKDTDLNRANSRALLIVWLCGMALLTVFCVKATRKARQIDYTSWQSRIERMQDMDIDEDGQTELEIDNANVIVKDKKGKTLTITKEGVKIETESAQKPQTKDSINIVEADTIDINGIAH